jgi:hypothetical protein
MTVGLGLPEEFGLQKDRIRLRWEIPLTWRSACSAKLAERLLISSTDPATASRGLRLWKAPANEGKTLDFRSIEF